IKLAPRRIALWDTTTGSMPSGWTRFLLERFEYPFTVVCGAGFDDTNLRAKYDAIVLPSGASLRAGGGIGGRGGGSGGGDAAPSAAGAEDHIDVFFNNNPVFRLAPNAVARGIRPVMWFDAASPLRSGWAWGQNYLEGGTVAFEATVGAGKVFAFGPEITFRAQ